MAYPKAYAPEQGQKYQILSLMYPDREYEHCDYAVDDAEKDFLLQEYRLAYRGQDYKFKVITLPKKYWAEKGK